jgi:hypothetical protein
MKLVSLGNLLISIYFELYLSCLVHVMCLLKINQTSKIITMILFCKYCFDYDLFISFNLFLFYYFPQCNILQLLLLDFSSFFYAILCKDEIFLIFYLLRAIIICKLVSFKLKVFIATVYFPFFMTFTVVKKNYIILFIYYITCVYSKIEITCNFIALLYYLKYIYFTKYFPYVEEYKLNRKLKNMI